MLSEYRRIRAKPDTFAFQDAESIRLVSQIRAALAECRDIRLAENKVDRDEQLAMLSLVENPPAPPKNFTAKDVPDAVWIDCVEISRVSPMSPQ